MSTKKKIAPAKCKKPCCAQVKKESLSVFEKLVDDVIVNGIAIEPIAYPPVLITREEWKEFFSWLRSCFYEADHFDNIQFKNLEVSTDVRIYDILRFWVYGIKYKQQ